MKGVEIRKELEDRGLTPEQFVFANKQAVVKKWSSNILRWSSDVLENYFSLESPSFHVEVFDTVYNAIKNKENVVVAAPRGFGKSTMMMSIVLWSLLLNRKKFIIYISKSYEHAVKLIAPIKRELEQNELIRLFFGNNMSKKWTASDMELNNGSYLMASGRGQTVRGLKYLQYRPDLVILDDVEDDEEVENSEMRMDTQVWLDQQVSKGIDVEYGNIIAIGTVLHPDSLIANLAKPFNRLRKYDSYKTLFYQALDEFNKSIWPEKMPTEMLLKEREVDPYSFAKERMNQPIPIGAGMFKKEYFKYFTFTSEGNVSYEDKIVNPDQLNIYITVDLANTEREYSDFTVIMVSGISSTNDLFVLEYTKAKWADPSKTMDEIIRLYLKWKPKLVGIETVSFQKWMMVNLSKYMKEKNCFMPLTELKADRDKTRRISSLQPRFKSGSVWIRNTMVDLEEELLLFPKSSHDDIGDCLAYVLQIMTVPNKTEISKSEYMTFEWWRTKIPSKRNTVESKESFKSLNLVPEFT